LLELYQWGDNAQNIERVKEELADVLIYSITLAERLNLNINNIILEKITKNGLKYKEPNE
jgi:NTP pyrophosphatase (non-canonical NTP hydrolase)